MYRIQNKPTLNVKSNRLRIYHLSGKKDGFQRFSCCNSKSSENWLQYNIQNFKRGKVFSAQLKKEMEIIGRPCLSCIKLIKNKLN